LTAYAQSKTVIPSRDSLQILLLHNNFNHTLRVVNENLIKDLTPAQTRLLETYKIRPLIEANMLDDAFKLSNKLLAIDTLDLDLKIDILLNRALIFELKQDFEKSKADLDHLERLFNTYKSQKDEDYGEFLYRKASLYRVNDRIDSAKVFVKQSIAFSEKHNYQTSASVAYAVLGFLTYGENLKLTKQYYVKSLKAYKSIGDNSGVALMYANLANLELSKNDRRSALKYTDSMIQYAKNSQDNVPLHVLYELRSSIFEELKNIDSAYVNYQKYFKYYNDYKDDKREFSFQELNFQYQLEKEEVAKEQAVENNLRITKTNKTLKYFIIGLVGILALIFILNRKLFIKNKVIKQKTEEKEILLKELHHRVKNNLMLILSLVEFQKDDAKDAYSKAKMNDLQLRIEAIAVVHQKMMNGTDNQIDDKNNIKIYFNQIAQSLISLNPELIDFDSNIVELNVPLDMAVPLGILINELISNSLKHAQPIGALKISLHVFEENNQLKIEYKDNGVLISDDDKENLGTFIIENMVKQLKGQLTKSNYNYDIILNRYL
jgi:two-component sensor histidine kinase